MDAKELQLKEKLDFQMKQATQTAVELQALIQGKETPHYDQIELPAHALGQQFSRMIQAERARHVAAEGLQDADCPSCGCSCRVEAKQREVHSMDGPLELTETIAHCRRCRRSFFPSACAIGVGRPRVDARL